MGNGVTDVTWTSGPWSLPHRGGVFPGCESDGSAVPLTCGAVASRNLLWGGVRGERARIGDSTVAPREPRRLIPLSLLAVLTIASGATTLASSQTSNFVVGSEGVVVYEVPDLAGATSTQSGQSVDGVGCQTQAKEVVKYHIHIHIHVAIDVDGLMVRLPGGIGITQPPLVERYPSGDFYDVGLYDCLYRLHTHVADEIIHVEAPAKQTFTPASSSTFGISHWGCRALARRRVSSSTRTAGA